MMTTGERPVRLDHAGYDGREYPASRFTDGQLDGVLCILCGAEYAAAIPVGMGPRGQVFAHASGCLALSLVLPETEQAAAQVIRADFRVRKSGDEYRVWQLVGGRWERLYLAETFTSRAAALAWIEATVRGEQR